MKRAKPNATKARSSVEAWSYESMRLNKDKLVAELSEKVDVSNVMKVAI